MPQYLDITLLFDLDILDRNNIHILHQVQLIKLISFSSQKKDYVFSNLNNQTKKQEMSSQS